MNTEDSTLDLIDETARRSFESAWLLDAPRPIEHYLPEPQAPAYLATLEELIHIELEFAWKSWSQRGGNRPPGVADYLQRFSQLDKPESKRRLLEQELLVRRRYDNSPPDTPLVDSQTTFDPTKLDNLDCLPPGDLPNIPGYAINGVLGRGGMGLVLKAKQLSLGRTVALKMILAASSRRENLLRFRIEAEAAARLQHPNIVQIHEVGEHNGWPFLTLEYVAGGSLAQHLAGKPQHARFAAAFVAILARAVHHAHERGIIHRDLKPGNILLHRVDSRENKVDSSLTIAVSPATNQSGVAANNGLLTTDYSPKITDFGLAKILDADSRDQTETGSVLGTPAYMAPEQASGQQQHIGTATDVYALGAILYELLTGRPPFRGASAIEIMDQVRSHDPAPPGKLVAKLPVDLETICLTCLAKPTAERYGSALALAEDLQRFLDGEPILARPIASWERALKWMRRRPAWAALICVTLLATVTLFAVIGVSYSRIRHERDAADELRLQAEAERQRALANLREARLAVDQLLTRVGFDRLDSVPYMETVRRELLQDALKFYQGFVAQQSDDAELRFETGKAWRRLGKIHEALGERAQEEQSYREALAIQKQLATEQPDDLMIRAELAACHNNLGVSLQFKNPAEAMQESQLAVELQEGLITQEPQDAGRHQAIGETCDLIGHMLTRAGNPEEAEQWLRRARESSERAVALEPGELGHQLALSVCLRNWGVFLARRKRFEEAEPVFRQDLKCWEEHAQKSPGQPRFRRLSADAAYHLGSLLVDMGKPIDGEKMIRRATETYQGMVDEFPKVPSYHARLGDYQARQARLMRERRDFASAAGMLAKAVVHRRQGWGQDAPSITQQADLAALVWLQADGQIELYDYREAARLARELPTICPERWQEYYQSARLLTRCMALAASDKNIGESVRNDLTESYAQLAVKMLRDSFSHGCKDHAFVKTDKGLNVLRSRQDFKQFLAEVIEKPHN